MMVPVGYHGYETCSFMLMAEHKPRVFKKTVGSGEYLDLTKGESKRRLEKIV